MGPQRKDESRTRLSPGEAAFQRLREREAVRQATRKLPRPPAAVAPVAGKVPVRRLEDIEASLRDQLRLLDADVVKRESSPSQPSAPQRPRSVFAPDPVRQRNTVDLQASLPPRTSQPQSLPYEDTPRALVEPSTRRHDDARTSGGYVQNRARSIPSTSARDRGLDARTLSIAALIGVGIGFLGLTFMAVMTRSEAPTLVSASLESGPPVLSEVDGDIIRSDTTVSVVTPATTKEQSRLLSAAEPEPVTTPEPEPKLQAEPLRGSIAPEDDGVVVAIVPAMAPPVARVEEQPVQIDQPAKAAPADPAAVVVASPAPAAETNPAVGGRILSYAPVERTGNRARRSTARATDVDSGPAEVQGPGLGRTNVAVNMRSAPDNDAPVVTVVPAGATVQIQNCTFWCSVVANGQRGYIYRKFVGR